MLSILYSKRKSTTSSCLSVYSRCTYLFRCSGLFSISRYIFGLFVVTITEKQRNFVIIYPSLAKPNMLASAGKQGPELKGLRTSWSQIDSEQSLIFVLVERSWYKLRFAARRHRSLWTTQKYRTDILGWFDLTSNLTWFAVRKPPAVCVFC